MLPPVATLPSVATHFEVELAPTAVARAGPEPVHSILSSSDSGGGSTTESDVRGEMTPTAHDTPDARSATDDTVSVKEEPEAESDPEIDPVTEIDPDTSGTGSSSSTETESPETGSGADDTMPPAEPTPRQRPRRSRPVELRKVGKSKWTRFSSQAAAAVHAETTTGSISSILNGKRRRVSANGYEFLQRCRAPNVRCVLHLWPPKARGHRVSDRTQDQQNLGTGYSKLQERPHAAEGRSPHQHYVSKTRRRGVLGADRGDGGAAALPGGCRRTGRWSRLWLVQAES